MTKVQEKPFTEKQEKAYGEFIEALQKYSKLDSPVHKGKLKAAELSFIEAFIECLPIRLSVDKSWSFDNLHILIHAIIEKIKTYRTISID